MRSIPPINLAILHACNLSASGHQLAWALGIENQSTNATAKDRACAGFPEVVYASLFEADGTSGFLSQHATSVYKDIADGKTVWQAVDYANKHFTPMRISNGQAHSMPMVLKDDYNMRLVSVYTGNTAFPDSSPANPEYPQHSNYPYIWRKVMP